VALPCVTGRPTIVSLDAQIDSFEPRSAPVLLLFHFCEEQNKNATLNFVSNLLIANSLKEKKKISVLPTDAGAGTQLSIQPRADRPVSCAHLQTAASGHLT